MKFGTFYGPDSRPTPSYVSALVLGFLAFLLVGHGLVLRREGARFALL